MLPKKWSLKVTSEALPFINQARLKNSDGNYTRPLRLDEYFYVNNDTKNGDLILGGGQFGKTITLEMFKEAFLSDSSNLAKHNSSTTSSDSSDYKVGYWYKLSKESLLYYFKFEKLQDGFFWGSQYSIGGSGRLTRAEGYLTEANYSITLASKEDIIKFLPSGHEDLVNFPGDSTVSYPKSSPDHKFSVGDKVIYQNSETVIVRLSSTGRYIVEYKNGWGGNLQPEYGLDSTKNYHWVYDSSLKAAKQSDLTIDTSSASSYSSSSSTPSKKWNVGDKITYKAARNCTNASGESGKYYQGGRDQEGFEGTILAYNSYDSSAGCYKISVSTKNGETYSMLEREFYEYDGSKPPNSNITGVDSYSSTLVLGLFNFGDIVVNLTDVHPIIRMKGDMFEVLRSSDANNLHYGTRCYSSSSLSSWRLATTEEKAAFRSGVKNIKNLSSNPCAEVLLADSDTKKSSKMQALPHQSLVECAQPKRNTKLIY